MSAACRMFLSAAIGLSLVMASGGASDTVHVDAAPGDDLQAVLDEAAPGSRIVLSPGTHRGPVVVRQRLTLAGGPGVELRGGGRGSVVTIEANDAHVDGLRITGSGRRFADDDAGVLVTGDRVRVTDCTLARNLHGIYVRGGGDATVKGNQVIGLAAFEDEPELDDDIGPGHGDDIHHDPPGTQSLMGNGIHLWNAGGARVIDNHIQHARDGIYVAHTSDAAFEQNRIHESRYGIHYMYSSNNTIRGNELWDNVAGAALMFSRHLEVSDNVLRDHSGLRAYGLLLQDVDVSVFERNAMRGNRVGLRLQASSGNTFRDNLVLGNLAGMTLNSSSIDNAWTRNTIGPNLRQLELTGPVPNNAWSIDGVGNRWHGAMAIDLTGDGISQWPHHEADLLAERRERFPYIQLLEGSPGVRAVEWALTRAPLPGTRYITDPHPLLRSSERDDD